MQVGRSRLPLPRQGLGRPLVLGVVLAAATLAGCASVSDPGASAGSGVRRASAEKPISAARASAGDARIVHVLNRIGYGPRPGDIERVRAMGLAAYIEQQLSPGPSSSPAVETALESLPTLRLSIPELLREYPRPNQAVLEQLASGQMSPQEYREQVPPEKRPARIVAQLQAARIVRAVASERQLEEVLVDFWLNHFNVFANKGDVRWYVTSYERDAIRPHVFGKFGDLVRATARHPAMLYYLDNWLSAKPGFIVPAGPNRGSPAGLNENYARELMELHTLGVDGGYAQQDVTEVARAFTGWTIDRPRVNGRFVFRPTMHDTGVKAVLGQKIAGDGGEREGERVIEILTHHPSTARFIATKLTRRFVSDDPPPALVERVAATYRRTDGDVRAMLRVILSSPEFYANETRQAKIKKPFELVASAVRALGGTVDARGGHELARAAARIGEGLYEAQPPTGYADRAEAWVNTGALLARMNFALALAQGRFPGVRVDVESLVAGADPREPASVLDRLLAAIVPQQVGEGTRAVLT